MNTCFPSKFPLKLQQMKFLNVNLQVELVVTSTNFGRWKGITDSRELGKYVQDHGREHNNSNNNNYSAKTLG